MKDLENRTDIKTLIDAFYKKAVKDESIGHFFTEVIQLDFEKHMPKMYDFWKTTLFHKALYKGNPMMVHQALQDKSPLKKEHYERWVKLFTESCENSYQSEIHQLEPLFDTGGDLVPSQDLQKSP